MSYTILSRWCAKPADCSSHVLGHPVLQKLEQRWIDYANIKRIIQDLCFVKVILINLQHVDNGSSKVTISTVDANQAAIILRKLNGLEIEGYKLRVDLGHDAVKDRSPSPSYEEKRKLITNYNEYIKQIEPLQAPLPPRISSPSISSILGDTSPEDTHRKRSSPKSLLRRRRSLSKSSHRRPRSRSRSRGYNSHRSKRNRSRRHRRSRSRNERSQSPDCCRKRSRAKSRSPRAKKLRPRSKSRHRNEWIRSSKSISRSPPKIQRDSYRCRSRNSASIESEGEDLLNSKIIIHISASNDTEKESVVSTTSDNNCLNDEPIIDAGFNNTKDTEETLTIAKSNCAKTNDEKIRDDFEKNTKLKLNFLNKHSTSKEGTTMLSKRNVIGENNKHNTPADPRHKTHGLNQQFKRNVKDYGNIINQFEDINTATAFNRCHSNMNVLVTSNKLYNHNQMIEPSRDVINFRPNQFHPDSLTNLAFEQNIGRYNNLVSAGFESNNDNFHFLDSPANFDDRYQSNINNPHNQIFPNMSVRDDVFCRQEWPPNNAHRPLPNINYSNRHNFAGFNHFNGPPQNVMTNHNDLLLQYTQAPRNAGPTHSLMDFNNHGGNSEYHQNPNQFINFDSNPTIEWHENMDMPLSNKALNNFKNYQSHEFDRSRGTLFNKPQYFEENRHRPENETKQIIGVPKKSANIKTYVLKKNEIIIDSNTDVAQNSDILIPNSVHNNSSNVDLKSDESNTQIEAIITEEPEDEIKLNIEPKRKRPTFNERKAKELNKYTEWKAKQSDYVINDTAISFESDDQYLKHLIGASKKLSETIIQSTPKKHPTSNEYYILRDYIADKLNKLIKDKGASLELNEEVYVNFFLDEHKEESHREFMEIYYKWCSEVFYLTEDDWDIECEKVIKIYPPGKKKRRRPKNRNKNRNKNRKHTPKRLKGQKIGNIRLQHYPKRKKDPASTSKLTEDKNEDEPLENSEATNQRILREQNSESQETTESLNPAHDTVLDGIESQSTDMQEGLTEQLENTCQTESANELNTPEIYDDSEENYVKTDLLSILQNRQEPQHLKSMETDIHVDETKMTDSEDPATSSPQIDQLKTSKHQFENNKTDKELTSDITEAMDTQTVSELTNKRLKETHNKTALTIENSISETVIHTSDNSPLNTNTRSLDKALNNKTDSDQPKSLDVTIANQNSDRTEESQAVIKLKDNSEADRTKKKTIDKKLETEILNTELPSNRISDADRIVFSTTEQISDVDIKTETPDSNEVTEQQDSLEHEEWPIKIETEEYVETYYQLQASDPIPMPRPITE